MIFSDSPHYIHTNSYVYGSSFRAWRLHCDPWCPFDYNIIKYRQRIEILYLLKNISFFKVTNSNLAKVNIPHHSTHHWDNLCRCPLWPSDYPPTGRPTPGHPAHSWSAPPPLVRAPPPKRSPQDYDGWCHTGTTPAQTYRQKFGIPFLWINGRDSTFYRCSKNQ